MKRFLLLGASSGIALACRDLLLQRGPQCGQDSEVIVISRGPLPPALSPCKTFQTLDYSPQHLAPLLDSLDLQKGMDGVFIFTGILHGGGVNPEKSLQALDADTFAKVMHINAFVPAQILQQLIPRLPRRQAMKITVLSARVGSIGDNSLGGWHSYRASKAALNMLLKTIAIECRRTHPGIKLISYHPGTTDTPLSAPFQKNLAPKQLFTPQQAAAYCLDAIGQQPFDGELSFIDWQGQAIPW